MIIRKSKLPKKLDNLIDIYTISSIKSFGTNNSNPEDDPEDSENLPLRATQPPEEDIRITQTPEDPPEEVPVSKLFMNENEILVDPEFLMYFIYDEGKTNLPNFRILPKISINQLLSEKILALGPYSVNKEIPFSFPSLSDLKSKIIFLMKLKYFNINKINIISKNNWGELSKLLNYIQHEIKEEMISNIDIPFYQIFKNNNRIYSACMHLNSVITLILDSESYLERKDRYRAGGAFL